MPTPTKATQEAKTILFKTGYRNCRTLRDIIGYLNGDTTHLRWHPHMQVSRDLIAMVHLNEFLGEFVRWRDIYEEPWQHLIDRNLVISAMEEQHDRPIEQLVQICDQTSLMIQSLEHRLLKVLLEWRFAHLG